MALPAFDTHNYVKRLKLVGVDEKQAEVQAELQAEILSALVTEKLATKEDVQNFKQEIKEEISELRHRFIQLNWMFGFLLTATVGILAKLFFH